MARRGALVAAVAALLFLLEAHWVLSGGAAAFDRTIRGAVHAWAAPPLTSAMRAITMLGASYVFLPLGALLAWRVAAAGRSGLAILFVAASLSAELVCQLLKLAAHRTRPDVFFGLKPAETYSFPSGHSFLSTVFYGFAAAIAMEFARSRAKRAWLAAGAIAVAGLVGLSRVYLGYHYPSDVLGGWTCGIAWLTLALLAAAHVDRPGEPEEERH